VKRAFETNGVAEDCDYVMNASNTYRRGQDNIAAFVAENVEKTGVATDKIKKNELSQQFKMWFLQEQGGRKMPKGQELYQYMDKKFGSSSNSSWSGVKMKYPDQEDEMEAIE
jgi:hypothetical protein